MSSTSELAYLYVSADQKAQHFEKEFEEIKKKFDELCEELATAKKKDALSPGK